MPRVYGVSLIFTNLGICIDASQHLMGKSTCRGISSLLRQLTGLDLNSYCLKDMGHSKRKERLQGSDALPKGLDRAQGS